MNMNYGRNVATRRPMQASRVASSYVPQHLRLTQYTSQDSIVEESSPIMTDGEMMMSDDGYVDSMEVVGGPGGYFDTCDPCFDRGGCGPCALENCWLYRLGPIFRNTEWGFGATGFKSPRYDFIFEDGAGDEVDVVIPVDDSSFGYYFDFNMGVPLCNLTCGLLSAQFGVRSVHTNFDGNPISRDGRNQMFITTGLYRRVDYGLQLGVVADFLQEDWFIKTKVTQVRGDIAWVYPTGKVFGFRFATNTKTDGGSKSGTIELPLIGEGVIDWTATMNAETLNNYRFYYQYQSPLGGMAEYFAGWSNQSNGIFGAAWDLPLKECVSVKTGFTYFAPGNDNLNVQIGGDGHDCWNVYSGCIYRPRGRSWNRSYDKPLFNVADNGSMIIVRDVEVTETIRRPF